MNACMFARWRNCRSDLPCCFFGRFPSGSGYGRALRHFIQKCGYVGGCVYFKKLVACIAVETFHGYCRVVYGNAFERKQFRDFFQTESLVREVNQSRLVPKENQPEYPPHVVDEVWIEKAHGPPVCGWRKTSEHEQSCFGRNERLQRVVFYHFPNFCGLFLR